jgi:uncharacterized protein YchJ
MVDHGQSSLYDIAAQDKFLQFEVKERYMKHITVRHDPYISEKQQPNNSPCNCGSGIKYKKCCKFKK